MSRSVHLVPALIVLAALASGPTAARANDTTAAETTVAAPEMTSDAPEARAADAHCLTETGSRIKTSAERPCISAPGSVYSRDDIDRTGATSTAEALRRLSPSIR
ncbi:MAG: hypothetical protein PHP86_02155 [Nevskiales bacterium]|nr:hypothetical protein [Nevskiales bacterium]